MAYLEHFYKTHIEPKYNREEVWNGVKFKKV